MLHKALQEANPMFPEAKALLPSVSVTGLTAHNEHLLTL